ncbi:MAG TPA: YceD family protein [Burkholderiales bacterium]|nr:YceD family protein [Burkholderiales bacterium]
MPHQPVIDGLEFARTGGKLQGSWSIAGFARLREMLYSDSGTLRYELEGVPEAQGRPALRLKLEGAMQLVCQRCLGALDFPLRIESLLLLAATQAEIDAEPLEAEGPERIVAGREMPVQALVEDELLLAIPIAPRHERCAAGGAQDGQAPRSPFAALRGLMAGTKH